MLRVCGIHKLPPALDMAYMKSFKAFLQREAREQLAKIILVGAASIGVEELELAGAELKRTLRGLVACGSCRFRLRPATAGITSLRHHSNTASFSRRRPTRTLLVNNSFPRVKKRTKMKPGRSVVFSTRMPLSARLVRTTLSSGLQSTHSSTVTKLLSSCRWARMCARLPLRPPLCQPSAPRMTSSCCHGNLFLPQMFWLFLQSSTRILSLQYDDDK